MTQAIYEPKGRAREYAPLACNLYRGCAHGCTYCYAPSVLHMPRDEFHGNPQPRPGILEALEKDAAKLAGDPRPVLLCFTTDPYQPINDRHEYALRAMQILRDYKLTFEILTKRPHAALADLRGRPSLQVRCSLGSTLTFYTTNVSRIWEPGADDAQARIAALCDAHHLGVHTWASLEPVIDPFETLRVVDETHTFIDLYKVGRWNYDKRANDIDWPAFRERVVEKLEKYGKKYLIKKDLLEAR